MPSGFLSQWLVTLTTASQPGSTLQILGVELGKFYGWFVPWVTLSLSISILDIMQISRGKPFILLQGLLKGATFNGQDIYSISVKNAP